MDDIEILKLENKALRLRIESLVQTCEHLGAANVKLNDEVQILRRYAKLIKRSTEIVQKVGKVTAEDLKLAQTIFGA